MEEGKRQDEIRTIAFSYQEHFQEQYKQQKKVSSKLFSAEPRENRVPMVVAKKCKNERNKDKAVT